MAKKFYEMLPHQYAEHLCKKEDVFEHPITKLGRKLVWNEKYIILSAARDILQGKTPYDFKFRKDKEKYQKPAEEKAQEIRFEHAKHIYLAQKAGIKVHNRILRCYPDINKWAVVNGWDKLEVSDIKEANHYKKEVKPTPARELQDDFEDKFAKLDKESW